ncbi:MAG: PilZ domain-containing protein [Burkholderiaceae bacterium]
MTREQRQSARKRLESGGILSVDGTQHRFSTIDVSAGGLSVAMSKQLTVRRNCHVQFALDVAGQTHIVAASCHVVYCFYTGGKAYRAGLQFLSVALNGAELIDCYLAAETVTPE